MPVFFLFFAGGSGQTGKPWENVVAVQMAAIHLGIGHITGWTIGDQVRQVVPPNQQANLDVIICQDDVIRKNIVVFRFLRVDYL